MSKDHFLNVNRGEGLGKNKNGIKEIIQIKRRDKNIGLGKEVKQIDWSDKWWENSYNNILKNINPNQTIENDEDISEDETEPDKKEEEVKTIKKKSKKEKKEEVAKEVLFLKKKRKITILSI